MEAGKRPFFAYLPYTPPHGPFAIPVSDPAVALYKDKPWPKDAKLFAALVSMLDRQVGEVLDLIKMKGIEQDTLIFFSGDNGSQDRFADKAHPRGLFSGNKDPNGPTEFRGAKGAPYDGAMRVPAAITWPGKIQPGRVSAHLCYFPDVLPTIAAAAGADVPAEVDGISFLSELIGEKAAGQTRKRHDYLYWEKGKWSAIRQGDWRAVNPGKHRWELYNVSDDPAESKDLAKANPEIVAKLSALAKQAHEPERPGTYTTKERADRDRRRGGAEAKEKQLNQ
jgi:arylsulfatase A-like enzyme